MSVLSAVCCSLLSAACAFTLLSAAGCGTDARGVDDCRDIEQARCSAAKNCGAVSSVSACQRFYRDQCLHGLPVASPGMTQVKACVAVIRSAGLCALEAGTDAPSPGCSTPEAACQVVLKPETSPECAFLAASPNTDAGSGGSGGTGDAMSAAGADDSAGATGG